MNKTPAPGKTELWMNQLKLVSFLSLFCFFLTWLESFTLHEHWQRSAFKVLTERRSATDFQRLTPTWREQLRSLESLISSFSTDWQMGHPSPCSATLFTSRKLQRERGSVTLAWKTEEIHHIMVFSFWMLKFNLVSWSFFKSYFNINHTITYKMCYNSAANDVFMYDFVFNKQNLLAIL